MNFVFEKGMVKIMKKDIKKYEPPSMKVYRFTDQDKVLTVSGGIQEPGGSSGSEESSSTAESTTPTTPTPNYAANALNQLFGGTNTTIE